MDLLNELIQGRESYRRQAWAADMTNVAALTMIEGRESYRRQAWAAAYQSLAQADQATLLDVEDLERLATSAYLSGREDECLRVLERAHQA